MKKLLIILTMMIFISPACEASGATMRGSRSCTIWLAEKGTSAGLTNETWLLGFLSGLSINSDDESFDFFAGLNNDIVFRWVDAYCTRNQAKSIGIAGSILFEERRLRAR